MGERLEVGMLIRTNYSGPYRILEIKRGCTCPSYLDTMNMATPPSSPEHIHLVLTNPDGSDKYWLNHFIEETLTSISKSYCGKNVLDYDRIIIMKDDHPVQTTLAL
jgi:hypothetical protein